MAQICYLDVPLLVKVDILRHYLPVNQMPPVHVSNAQRHAIERILAKFDAEILVEVFDEFG